MAAKRLGSALTNITGTSKQLLRVKEDESGFEFLTPATIPSYTVTNKTEDRVINADDVTLDEVADVLSTLIDDLTSAGLTTTGPRSYSTQVSHTGNNGGTEYTIVHNLGVSDVSVEVRYPSTTQNRCLMCDYFAGTNAYGFDLLQCQPNQCVVRIYRFPTGNDTATLTCDILVQPANNASGAGISAFQWSTSEQVYPFEKDTSGRTLYCKQVDVASMPNNGTVSTAHNISSLDLDKVFLVLGVWSAIGGNAYPAPFAHTNGANSLIVAVDTTYVHLSTSANFSDHNGRIRLIYAK